jgi:predicted PurR-regulated permease PerM
MNADATVKEETPPTARPGQISIEARVSDLVRLGIIAVFAYFSAQLIAPFALIAIWAGILTVALYPLFDLLRRILGGRRILAATVLVLACLFVIIGPVALVATNFAETLQSLVAGAGGFALPQAPERLKELPLFGNQLYSAWNQAASNLAAAIVTFQAPLREVGAMIVAKLASIGGGILSFIASIILCGVLLTVAPRLTLAIQILANRIAGDRGVGFAKLAGTTVRNVSRGVIGVAFLQTLLCGLVFIIFDVPARGVLTFAVFILCIIQIGPGLILVPAIIWAWFSWPIGVSAAFTIVAVPVMLMDNILKPILMSRGLSTPMPVILIGVIGGTISHGLLGLFLGPVVLSVFYDLLLAWVWPTSPAVAVGSDQPKQGNALQGIPGAGEPPRT